MSFRSFWPASLAGRTSALLLITALVVYLGGIAAYRSLVERAAESGRLAQIAGRLETAIGELGALPIARRAGAAAALSSADFQAAWSPSAPIVEVAADPELRNLSRRLTRLVPRLAGRDIHLRWDTHAPEGKRHILDGAVALPDGSYVVFSATLIPRVVPPLEGTLFIASLVFASIIVVAVLLLRTINAPLRRLTEAANRYAHDHPIMLAETGPREIADAARAFNAMQRRIHRLVADRTEALAAVSHDLRTPIARLRLRSGLLGEEDVRAEIERDLAEMEAMIDATLAYLRGEDESEAPRFFDIVSVLSTLVDAAVDAGHVASLAAPRHATLMLRAVSVKRAFANLIDNAIAYGAAAHVALRPEDRWLVVTIDDDGAGIAEEDLETVFEPFRRLESSRNRSTGGVGLGLAIARRAFEREGGHLTLKNRPEGGLRAEVRLPIRRSDGVGG